ncbi:MAG: zinc ribbon domain-containing protein [Armatimonadota bacterium]|jgi:putative FmdB family regulatory protein|nr:zinc ribbon domain-containing protein [Armatimonadota bacterium]MDT7971532.1 zinc ribbon domain-containing protein [Armatimonadota bacterium]
MPLYEFRCNQCGKVFTFLVGVVADNTDPYCPRCGSTQLTKLISRIRAHLSEETRLDNLASSFENLDISDNPSPRELRSVMRRLTSALGDEVDREVIDEMEAAMEEELRGEGKESGAERDETIY